MTDASYSWARAFVRPGAVVFATLFAVDSMARALLSTIIPLQAYQSLGNSERDVSILFFLVGWVGIAATLFIPVLIRRLRPRWVYTLAAILLVIAPGLLALGTFPGLVSGMLVRAFAAACLLNLINLYIMAYIRRQDLARSEPLRTFFSAFAWTVGPSLGGILYNDWSPNVAYGLSSIAAVLLLGYFWWLRLEYGPALPPDQPASTNPFPHIRRFCRQPRLVLAWVLNFIRETWWVTFFIYGPILMVEAGRNIDADVSESRKIGSYLVSCGTVLLFTTPLSGWLARRFGIRRHLIVGFLLCGVATLAAASIIAWPSVAAALGVEMRWLAAGCLILAALGAVNLDSVITVPFLRAVRARERPEMTMVFSIYRDAAGLVPLAVFSVLLTFFGLSSVFFAVGFGLLASAWLSRWIPRGM